MKRVNSCVLFASILLCVIVVVTNGLRLDMSHAAAREENAMRPILVKRRDVSSQAKEDSGKMKKLYSNKEIVAFDDEDEQHEQQQQPIIADESPSMSPVLSRSQRTDTHTRKKLAFERAQQQKQQQQQQKQDGVISDELIDMLLNELANEEEDEDDIGEQYEARAKKPIDVFRNQNDLPGLDYYEAAATDGDESEDLDQLIEDEMKLNELVKSLGLKSSSNNRVINDETGEMFAGKKIQNNNNNKNAPVNKVQVQEKLMLEKEYNDELKARLKQQQQQDDKKDQFFTQEVSLGLLKPTASVSGSSGQASMLKQQQTLNHEADPNLSSKIDSLKQQNDYLFMFVVAGCILAGVVALIAAGVCWYTVHKSHKATEAEEYGVKIGKFNSKSSVKSTSSSSGDRRLAQSAQMYHYQHQKQQMIAMEKANNDTKPDNSDNSEGETEEGDYTVYECPGLAPTGEMEVKNPLFKEDFSQSLNNINTASTAATTTTAPSTAASPPPPAYSTLAPASGEQLVQISGAEPIASESAVQQQAQQQSTDTVEHVNEVSTSQPQQ